MQPVMTAASSMALKIVTTYAICAALAALLGLVVLPPRSRAELMMRTASTLVCSFAFGPALAAAALAWFPALTDALVWLADHGSTEDEFLAKLYVIAPCMLLAGLPAWWMLGGYMRWVARIRKIGLLPWLDELRARLPLLGGAKDEE